MLVLLALILCLGVFAGCFAEEPGVEFHIYDQDGNEPKYQINGPEYDVTLSNDTKYILEIKAESAEKLQVSKNEDAIDFEEPIDISFSDEYRSGFWIYIDQETDGKIENLYKIRIVYDMRPEVPSIFETVSEKSASANPSPESEPPATEPEPAEPPATEQEPAEPPATEQEPAEPPATEPEPAEPPATEPEPTETPITEPDPTPEPARGFEPETDLSGDVWINAKPETDPQEWKIKTEINNLQLMIKHIPEEANKIFITCNGDTVEERIFRKAADTNANQEIINLTEYVQRKINEYFGKTEENGEDTFKDIPYILSFQAEFRKQDTEDNLGEKEFIIAVYPELQVTAENPEISSDDPTVRVRVNRKNGNVTVKHGEETVGTCVIDAVNAVTPIDLTNIESLGDNATLTVRYENDVDDPFEMNVTYTRKWEDIRAEGTGVIHHLYFTDGDNGNRKVPIYYGNEDNGSPKEPIIRITGEPGQTIVAKPIFAEGSGKPTNMSFELIPGIGSKYEPTYDDLKVMEAIQLYYQNKQDENPKEIKVEVLEAGAPTATDDSKLTFRVYQGPTIAGKEAINEESTVQVTGAIPGRRLILAVDGADREDPITADEAGNASISGPFEAGKEISVRGTDDFGMESTPDRAMVQKTELEAITISGAEPETVNLALESDPSATVTIRGKAHSKCHIEAWLSRREETDSTNEAGEADKTTYPANADDNGEWTISIPISGKEDGTYDVTVRYAEAEDEERLWAKCTLLVDTKVLLTGTDGGDITATEGEDTIRVRCGEPIRKETMSLDFNPADEKNKQEDVAPYTDSEEEGAFFWRLPVPIGLQDKIVITAADEAGNEEEFRVTVVPGSFNLEVTTQDGKVIQDGEEVYLNEKNGITFRATGVAGTEVEVSLIQQEGNPVPLGTVTIGDPEHGSYVLTADALADRNLQEGETYTLTFRRKDQDAGVQTSFIYDTKCGLTAGTKDQDGNVKIFGEGEQIDFNTKTICGTTDSGATVTLSINDGEAQTQTAGEDGKYEFTNLTLKPKDKIQITATDKAGNQSETITRDVKSSKVAAAVLMALGAILLMFSLWTLMTTRKKIQQLEDISRAKTATIQEKKKR